MSLRAVYSIRIFSGDLDPAAGVVGPVVPDGFVYVVRDIDLVYHGATNDDELVFFNQTGGLMWIAVYTTGLTSVVWSWRGRQVFNEGEQVAIQSAGGTWSIAMSGYQLSTP